MEPNPHLSTAEAADRLGVSVPTVNRWARAGTLPFVAKAPGTRGANLFNRADVERLRDELGAADGPVSA